MPTLAAPQSVVMKDQRRDHQRVALLADARAAGSPSWSRSTSAERCSAASPARGSTRCWCATRSWPLSVSAGLYAFQRVGIFTVSATVKPGVDPAVVEKRLDELVADFIAKGPTEDEVRRAAVTEVGGRIRGLEQVGGFGGKAVTLAEGQTFAGDSELVRPEPRHLCLGHAG